MIGAFGPVISATATDAAVTTASATAIDSHYWVWVWECYGGYCAGHHGQHHGRHHESKS